MVITRLMGGLGNQMFQYAMGRRMALQLQAGLELDLTFFELAPGAHTTRRFELDLFEMPIHRAESSDLEKFRCFQQGGAVARIQRSIARLRSRNFIVDQMQGYDPKATQARGDVYLHGYWQSEKYFLPVADQIRADFQFKDPLLGLDLDLAQRIQRVNSIAIHVRRGDYVTDPHIKAYYASCDAEYYRQAIALIAEREEEIELFVFSDDPDQVRKELDLGLPTTNVEHNTGDRSPMDMRLMSLCRHNIIANSSFSWWAAWLNENPEKMVVAPKRWFQQAGASSKDLIPDRWITL